MTPLIQGCINNDRRSQEQFYKLHYAHMMRLALIYLVDKRDAQEAVNDAFLKVFMALHKFDPKLGSIYTWIRQILIYTALDYRQRHKSFLEVNDNWLVVYNLAPDRIDLKVVLKSLKDLPKHTAKVFNLYHLQGYKHKEIGLLLGMSTGTSRWHLSEGKKLLK